MMPLPKKRDFSIVLKAILVYVPADQKGLKADLDKLQTDAAYCPPECLASLWADLSRVLYHHLGADCDLSWQRAISDIVQNRRPVPEYSL
jgi:hypothetical protein